MANPIIEFISGQDLNNSDTTGYNKFVDATVGQLIRTRIGEYDVPANVRMAGWGGGPLFIQLFDLAATALKIEGIFHFGVQGPSGRIAFSHHIPTTLAGATGQSAAPGQNWVNLPMASPDTSTIGGGKLIIEFENQRTGTAYIDTTDCLFYSLPVFKVV